MHTRAHRRLFEPNPRHAGKSLGNAKILQETVSSFTHRVETQRVQGKRSSAILKRKVNPPLSTMEDQANAPGPCLSEMAARRAAFSSPRRGRQGRARKVRCRCPPCPQPRGVL